MTANERRRLGALAALLALTTACDPASGDPADCQGARVSGRLPAELRESSGLAASAAHAGILWTHNDSGDEAVLYAIDTAGALRGRVRIAGASNEDWEDIAVGPCPAGRCVYIADTGDNDEKRDEVSIYRLEEPEPAARSARAERFAFRYPDGPRDVEAMFIAPNGDVYLVSKAASAPPTLYRYAAPLRSGETVTLERVQQLGDAPAMLPSDRITAADASGSRVAIRTYAEVRFYDLQDGRLTHRAGDDIVLGQSAGRQGESLAMHGDGTIFMTSETRKDEAGVLARIDCR